MRFIPEAETDLWQTPPPPPAWSWHVYTPTATHMHSLKHTPFAVKVWKRLRVITEQPKAPQGINNRPNPETTNKISRLQGETGARVCVWMWGALLDMNIWLAFVRALLLLHECLHVCVFDCAGSCDCVAWVHVCECEQRAPYLSHPTGLLWPPRTCWLLHSNPPKTFTP